MQNRTLNTGSEINAEIEAQLTNTNGIDNATLPTYREIDTAFIKLNGTVPLTKQYSFMYGSLRFAQLMAATVNNQERCVDLLLRWGVYVNEYDKGCLLLRHAAEKEYFFKQEPM